MEASLQHAQNPTWKGLNLQPYSEAENIARYQHIDRDSGLKMIREAFNRSNNQTNMERWNESTLSPESITNESLEMRLWLTSFNDVVSLSLLLAGAVATLFLGGSCLVSAFYSSSLFEGCLNLGWTLLVGSGAFAGYTILDGLNRKVDREGRRLDNLKAIAFELTDDFNRTFLDGALNPFSLERAFLEAAAFYPEQCLPCGIMSLDQIENVDVQFYARIQLACLLRNGSGDLKQGQLLPPGWENNLAELQALSDLYHHKLTEGEKCSLDSIIMDRRDLNFLQEDELTAPFLEAVLLSTDLIDSKLIDGNFPTALRPFIEKKNFLFQTLVQTVEACQNYQELDPTDYEGYAKTVRFLVKSHEKYYKKGPTILADIISRRYFDPSTLSYEVSRRNFLQVKDEDATKSGVARQIYHEYLERGVEAIEHLVTPYLLSNLAERKENEDFQQLDPAQKEVFIRDFLSMNLPNAPQIPNELADCVACLDDFQYQFGSSLAARGNPFPLVYSLFCDALGHQYAEAGIEKSPDRDQSFFPGQINALLGRVNALPNTKSRSDLLAFGRGEDDLSRDCRLLGRQLITDHKIARRV